MEVKSISLKRNESGQNLVIVNFDDGGTEKPWMPKWEDVRSVFQLAALTEYTNTKGASNQELEKFHNAARFVHEVCFWAILDGQSTWPAV